MKRKKAIAPFSSVKHEPHAFKAKLRKPHALPAGKEENAQDFARRLCELANERQSTTRRAAVSYKGLEALGRTMETIERLGGMFEAAERLEQMLKPMKELHRIIDSLKSLGQMGQLAPSTPDRPEGDVVSQMLADPRIDRRRFDHCTNCRKFYYKPRLRSRACGKRCEDALRSREHYWLEVGRRECALTLHSEGRSLFEIARTLGLKPQRVRQYLAGGKHHGRQEA
jgi:hypothetical protein